jgi:hypothetical protein
LISPGSLKFSKGTVKDDAVRNQPFLDYYKCPDDLGEFELTGEPSPEEGFFQFGPGTVCYGRCSEGKLARNPGGPLFDASGSAEVDEGLVRLPFDLEEVVNNLRRERYMVNGDTSRTLSILKALRHDIYYFFRPWMPVSARKYLQRIVLKDWRRIGFPHWPVDRTVDEIFEHALILSMKAKRISSVPFIWFWPDGAPSCAMMTHDVEASGGVNFCKGLMDLDDSYEIKSSFQIVPEERYSVSQALLEEFRNRGFEVNLQDLNHDGDLFRDREKFFHRARRINEYLRQFGSKGFRSAIMYRNAEWLEAIDASYDMSFPSVAHLEPQHGGCCTVMPYFIGGIVELPLTTTQDYSLLHILDESSIDLWKQQIQLITEKNGLISFIVHPDYLKGEREIGLYKSLLSHLNELREKGTLWIPLPREVDHWWRTRNQMKLVSQGGKWRIEGDPSRRARIAYAKLVDDRLTYSFEAEG